MNEGRGHHHRLNIPGFPPRPDGSKYGRKAQEHDEITQLIMRIIEAAGKGAMENPQQGLERQEYMN